MKAYVTPILALHGSLSSWRSLRARKWGQRHKIREQLRKLLHADVTFIQQHKKE